MIFSSLSKREKIIFVVTCLIVGCSLFFSIILESFINKWIELNKQIIAKELKLQKDIKLINKYEAIRKESKAHKPLFKSKSSDEEAMAAILTEIENLSRQSNVYVSVLKPYAIKDEKLYKKFVVEVDVDTTLKNLISFFYDIQNSPSILKIESVEINAKSDQKDFVKGFILVSEVLFKN